MNIYLDIDGVLLANDENLALHAEEFVKNIVEEYGASTYWLTTHCMHGDPQWAVQYVCRAGGESIRSHLEKIQPTTWSLMKTEAIDFSEPFIWFDEWIGEDHIDAIFGQLF